VVNEKSSALILNKMVVVLVVLLADILLKYIVLVGVELVVVNGFE